MGEINNNDCVLWNHNGDVSVFVNNGVPDMSLCVCGLWFENGIVEWTLFKFLS